MAFCDTMKKRSFPQGEKENCEDAMDSHKKVEGVKKVKFWLTLWFDSWQHGPSS